MHVVEVLYTFCFVLIFVDVSVLVLWKFAIYRKASKFTQNFCSSCTRLRCLQPETRSSNQVPWPGRRRERKHNQLRGRGRRRGRYDGVRHHPPPGGGTTRPLLVFFLFRNSGKYQPPPDGGIKTKQFLILVFQIPIADPSLAHRSLPRQKIPCKFLSSNIECCIL